MSRGSTFRILAEDNTGSKHWSKDQIHAKYKEELKHEYWSDKDDAFIEEKIKQEGYSPFIPLREEPDEDAKKYNYLPKQVENPFPIWINTNTGNGAYEITANEFMSDFDQLCQHLNINGCGATTCREISRKEAKEMLQVVRYFLNGKYNRDFEEAVFEDNEFFSVFEEQWLSFRNRFRKNRNEKNSCSTSTQTIRIIVEDRRVDVEKDYEEDDKYDYDAEEEYLSLEKEDRAQAEYLRSILEAFLLTGKSWVKEEEQNIIYRLVYEYWF